MTKAFWRLLVSQSVANLADVFFRVVIIANIFVLSGSILATSMAPILIGLSSFVASFLVPLVTRKIALNKVLLLTQGGKTVIFLLLVLLFYRFGNVSLLFLYVFIILISLLDGFAAPVSHAIIPQYATDLGKANAALSMSDESIQLVGWGLGGLLFAIMGLRTSMIIILVMFIISTVVMCFLPLVDIEKVESETSSETLTKGWLLVIKHPQLRFLVQVNLLEILANTIWVSSVILVFVTDILHQTESYWGYANSAYSLGILLGGFLVFRLSEKILNYKWQSMFFSLLAMAIVTLCIIQVPKANYFLIFSALTGFLSQLKEISESVMLQESVDDYNLVNVYSVFEVISTLAFSCFVFLIGLITDYFGVLTGFWLAIVCLILESILVFINRSKLIK
ncbi:ryptide export MFS transporter [Streptococcus gallolyticus]|uniref:ryptide export MFS transporter n=1 Tax=Streptococcus gallolyticus TaxID=315405 RepID=UPI00228450B8|nr:ryptide export MFS transporter [Streptococcus gallolyticus]MCY7184796.1 MFS transporter [Streptococcus gallolyticus subsp. gallolyticus]MCY7188732.1 MFS transporter [Streptococcus gallolyticus subsp. gallolyticus]MCY7192256.1 MFS transporter [Streptococcus gallolyticus subsp. gallolyticus]